MEAQVMDCSDDIAYSVHDVEDGIVSGRITLKVLWDLVELAALADKGAAAFGGNADELIDAAARLRSLPSISAAADFAAGLFAAEPFGAEAFAAVDFTAADFAAAVFVVVVFGTVAFAAALEGVLRAGVFRAGAGGAAPTVSGGVPVVVSFVASGRSALAAAISPSGAACDACAAMAASADAFSPAVFRGARFGAATVSVDDVPVRAAVVRAGRVPAADVDAVAASDALVPRGARLAAAFTGAGPALSTAPATSPVSTPDMSAPEAPATSPASAPAASESVGRTVASVPAGFAFAVVRGARFVGGFGAASLATSADDADAAAVSRAGALRFAGVRFGVLAAFDRGDDARAGRAAGVFTSDSATSDPAASAGVEAPAGSTETSASM